MWTRQNLPDTTKLGARITGMIRTVCAMRTASQP